MAPENLSQSQLLTPKQAAERLAISPRKLWSLTASGDVSCCRIGRSVRYSVDDLAAFIASAREQVR
jgi:excisionase family DNA binding protein